MRKLTVGFVRPRGTGGRMMWTFLESLLEEEEELSELQEFLLPLYLWYLPSWCYSCAISSGNCEFDLGWKNDVFSAGHDHSNASWSVRSYQSHSSIASCIQLWWYWWRRWQWWWWWRSVLPSGCVSGAKKCVPGLAACGSHLPLTDRYSQWPDSGLRRTAALQRLGIVTVTVIV